MLPLISRRYLGSRELARRGRVCPEIETASGGGGIARRRKDLYSRGSAVRYRNRANYFRERRNLRGRRKGDDDDATARRLEQVAC